jgi:hypothetical protein
MENTSELIFEILDTGDLIRIEPVQLNENSSEKNWIKSKVTIKGGAFGGQYWAEFMTWDFEQLRSQFEDLYTNLTGSAKFEPVEGQLILEINGDGLGHFDVLCSAMDRTGLGAKLSFELSFDQTELKRLVLELDRITKVFPVNG